jgi:hypothetical protein
MKFKGNFGELTLNINGTEATGTYQEKGVLKGEFINNTFKGQWENKGMEGLVEFTITDGELEGNWKKGVELGPMKGKWEGKLNAEDDTKQNSTNVTAIKDIVNLKKLYLTYFSDQTFDNVHDFISRTNSLFENFSWESEIDCEAISDLYKKLTEITLTDSPRYGGYLYLFTKISEKLGEGEYDTYFNWDIALEHGYDWNDITSSGETIVHKVGKMHEKNKFDVYFASLFVLTLLRSVDDASAEGIAEFIVANDIHAYGEVFKDVDVSILEDYIADYVIAILNAAGYDIYDYEGVCTINGIYFNRGFDMGYDYLRLAEDFRDSNI